MANNTVSINKIVSIFQDLAIRQEMLNDFGYGPAYNIGASREMLFPYIWIENNSTTTQKSDNGFKVNLYTFTFYCLDKINFGEDNYNEIISDTHYILDTMISEISQHKYYVDMNLSIEGDINFLPVVEATDDNVNGWQCDITIKQPVRYTYCNSPIEPITQYTTELNNNIYEWRLQGPTGPTGPTGPAPINYYGSFYDTTTQTNLGATYANIITYNNTDLSNGVYITASSHIVIENSGVYNIQFSAQFDKTDGGDDEVELWLRKNGNNVSHSNTVLSLHQNNAKEVGAWNFFVNANANDYYQLVWHSSDTQMGLLARGTQSNPDRPEVPSVILTVNKIN